MMLVDVVGIASAGVTFFSSSVASAALFVFRRDPSVFASAHCSGPSGWVRTSLMLTLLLSATRIIWLERFLSAFRTTFWPFIRDVFALIVVNVFSICFVVLSWNFTDGGSSSNMVHLNVWYASSPTSNALRRSLTTAGWATVPLDRLTRSDSSGDSGFCQLFSIRSIRDLMSASSCFIIG